MIHRIMRIHNEAHISRLSRRKITGQAIVWMLALALPLSLAGLAAAQTSRTKYVKTKTASTAQIMQSLGKVKLDEVKKNAPGGTITRVKADPGSRLWNLKVTTSYTMPDSKTVYYFDRRGVLVSLAGIAKKPISKYELTRQIKGLEFKKYPPGTYAAFVRRGPHVVQGFWLAPDGKYVNLTTYDYIVR